MSIISNIPPMLHTHLQFNTTPLRRTTGQSIGKFKKGMLFHILVSSGQKSTVILFWASSVHVSWSEGSIKF